MITELLEALSDITMSSDQIRDDIILLKFTIVNACIVGNVDNNPASWVLVDTALESSADDIVKTAEQFYGKNNPPKAIILTHGHFDHIGSVIKLAEHWDVTVYAHEAEIPYLNGQKDYPKGDSTVDGGLVAEMSPSFPHTSINLGSRIKPLPEDGSIPYMSGWQYIHTPGHTEGHISLFRNKDKVLIVGDAFTTVNQESFISVLTQKKDVGGPPAYLTTDWKAAENSVKKLAQLKPELVIPSHGQPMKGEELSQYLNELANNFKEMAVPEHGKFVR